MQGVFCINIVVEPDIVKTLRHMAGVTALSEVAVVVVVFAVTCNTGCVHYVTERIVAVAIVADQQGMFAQQVERRIPRMVKRGVMPVSRLVAVSAMLATAPVVSIVLCMATEAGGRRFDKAVIGMAVKAAGPGYGLSLGVNIE